MAKDKIIIRGAREHNLKNINLEIPRDKMVVFTGLSGSGKSSLAFDTIFAEGQRRYIESLSAYARQFLGKLDKPDVDDIQGLSPAISIDQKSHSANPRSTVATITEIYDYLRVLFARAGTPHCPQCGKEIRKMTIEEIVDSVIAISEQNKAQKNIVLLAPVVRGRKGEYYQLLYDFLNSGFSEARIDGKMVSLRERIELSRHKQHTIELVVDRIPSGLDFTDKDNRLRLSEAVESAVKYGNDVVTIITDKEVSLSAKFTCPEDGFSFPEIEPRLFSFNSPYGACQACNGLGTEDLWSEKICPVCTGKRLRPEALSVLIEGKNISSVVQMSISHAAEFFEKLLKSKDTWVTEIGEAPMREIRSRLKFMLNVGLHELRDLGNTIIVVEHDEETIRESDYLVDIGPAAGVHGGYIVAQGPIPEIIKDKKQNSPTLDYLRGKKFIEIPKTRRKVTDNHDFLKIRGATENNLQNINVDLPLRRLVAVTGVSGSGKSTLVYDVVYKALSNRFNGSAYKPGAVKSILGLEYVNRAVNVDQSAIGRTPRSNPATYVGAWTHIRDLFAAAPDARVRGYKPGRFSFNVKGGRCENCEGHGLIAIEMHFLPTVYVQCDICKGKRFDRETLEVKYSPSGKSSEGKNIYEVLQMTIEEATSFFEDIPWLHEKLKILDEVGLGYLQLGHPAPTLSGGEAQRIKLSAELGKRDTRRTIYLLDEPTTGLHFADIENLLKVLQKLVERGNTVLVIEHNLDVIKSADWVIDLGLEGGNKGGEVVAIGTPEDVAKVKKSYTGQYLAKVLKEKVKVK